MLRHCVVCGGNQYTGHQTRCSVGRALGEFPWESDAEVKEASGEEYTRHKVTDVRFVGDLQLDFKNVGVKIMKNGPFKQAAIDRAADREKLIDAVDAAKQKWENIQELTSKLASAVYAYCSFCGHYGECEDCPLGTPEKGIGRGCEDYTLITDELIPQIRKASDRVLAVIGSVDTSEKCMHLTEMDITIAEDDRRYFKCLDCGRHRTEEYL